MTQLVTPPIPVPESGPIVFVLDRTGSMHTRDCDEGTVTRWDYAISAIRSTLEQLHERKQPAMLITCGTTSDRPWTLGPLNQVLDNLRYGDSAFCIGQAALEAAWHAGDGYVVIIADGGPVLDSVVGQQALDNPDVMKALFQRTLFLTVGVPDAELQAFARIWPKHDSLDRLLYSADSREQIERAPTEPPPALDEGAVAYNEPRYKRAAPAKRR